jgi:predicted nucleic acid-binding protein
MICADTSSVVALLNGEQGRDVELVRNALIDGILVLAPASLAELLSDPEIEPPIEGSLLDIPQLEVTSGYWERAGKLRVRVIRHSFRPKLAASLPQPKLTSQVLRP